MTSKKESPEKTISKHLAWRNATFRNDLPAALAISTVLGLLFFTILASVTARWGSSMSKEQKEVPSHGKAKWSKPGRARSLGFWQQ